MKKDLLISSREGAEIILPRRAGKSFLNEWLMKNSDVLMRPPVTAGAPALLEKAMTEAMSLVDAPFPFGLPDAASLSTGTTATAATVRAAEADALRTLTKDAVEKARSEDVFKIIGRDDIKDSAKWILPSGRYEYDISMIADEFKSECFNVIGVGETPKTIKRDTDAQMAERNPEWATW